MDNTHNKTPTKVNTPSPVRVDADGNTWTIEDSNASEEEQGEHESGSEHQIPSPSDPRACAGSDAAGYQMAKPQKKKKKTAEKVIRDLLYPEDLQATPQLQSPASSTNTDSSLEEESVSKEHLDRIQSQLNEMRRFVDIVVKLQAKDINNLKMLARMHQRSTGAIRDDLNAAKFEITQSLQDLRLTEVENGYSSLNGWAADLAGRNRTDMHKLMKKHELDAGDFRS